MREMSDRELLELAAKAAGEKMALAYGVWNPLTDDGDALRLAVKLGISIQLHPAWVYARAVMPDDHYRWMEIAEGWGPGGGVNNGDTYTATRRCIVRAAAAIGQQEGE